MTAWLAENIGTIVVLILLIIIVGAIIASMIKDKKQGRTSCGCGCANCAMKGKCHADMQRKKVSAKKAYPGH